VCSKKRAKKAGPKKAAKGCKRLQQAAKGCIKAAKNATRKVGKSLFLNLSCCCLETGLKPVLFIPCLRACLFHSFFPLFFGKKRENFQSISITYLVNFREYTSTEREKKIGIGHKSKQKVVWIEGEEKIRNRVKVIFV